MTRTAEIATPTAIPVFVPSARLPIAVAVGVDVFVVEVISVDVLGFGVIDVVDMIGVDVDSKTTGVDMIGCVSSRTAVIYVDQLPDGPGEVSVTVAVEYDIMMKTPSPMEKQTNKPDQMEHAALCEYLDYLRGKLKKNRA